MAFGYKYWLVFVPEFHRHSFLLFVLRPDGATKLRDYADGYEVVLGQPRAEGVLGATVEGQTRFLVEPHRTEDHSHWHRLVQQYNRLHLGSASSVRATARSGMLTQVRNRTIGKATRGSRRQLQDYVNEHEAALTEALLNALPPRLRELRAHVRWVSPLACDDYIEYRDDEFLRAVGLGEFIPELAKFWPSGGPSWDALATTSDSNGYLRPGVVLLEAKSHIPEIYGNGCGAGEHSRRLIESSLLTAKQWSGADPGADWTGPLYQYANRIAHLYFLRERIKRIAWMVNVYFVDDPIGPTGIEEWKTEIGRVKAALGLKKEVPFMIDLFLPAVSSNGVKDSDAAATDPKLSVPEASPTEIRSGEAIESDHVAELPAQSICHVAPTFAAWDDGWMALAQYEGATLCDVSHRVEQLVSRWEALIPGSWKRSTDLQLLGPRYRRGDIDRPHRGEHEIEHQILCRRFDEVSCYGEKLLDGLNAVPLVRDSGGGRRANVEADMCLLSEQDGIYRYLICEVKANSSNAWYAAVESLRQLRLLQESEEAQALFARRNPAMCLPAPLPTSALVIAPPSFYSSPGQKTNAVEPALQLVDRFRSDFGVDLRLAVWDATTRDIRGVDGLEKL